MKRNLVLLASLLLFAQSMMAQTAGVSNNWGTKDRIDFIEECIKSASESMSLDSATSYCNCMLPKVEARYPRVEDAGKLTAKVLATPEWQKLINECLQSWTSRDRNDFIRECIGTAKESLSEEKATFYCNCMLVKVEAKYPTVSEAGKITETDLESPEFQKMIADCMGGWTSAERIVFTNECIKESRKTMSDQKARSYCDCAVVKVEYRLPLYADAQYLVPGKINSPHWQQVLLDCNK